jgi:hypothetical protein
LTKRSQTLSIGPGMPLAGLLSHYALLWWVSNLRNGAFIANCATACTYKTLADDIEAHFSAPFAQIVNTSVFSKSTPMNSSNKSTEFPDTQKAFLKSFLPEYETYIAEHNPDHKSHSKDLKEWRVKKARLLMQDTCIQDLVKNSPVEPMVWEKVVPFFSLSTQL